MNTFFCTQCSLSSSLLSSPFVGTSSPCKSLYVSTHCLFLLPFLVVALLAISCSILVLKALSNSSPFSLRLMISSLAILLNVWRPSSDHPQGKIRIVSEWPTNWSAFLWVALVNLGIWQRQCCYRICCLFFMRNENIERLTGISSSVSPNLFFSCAFQVAL